MSKLVKNLTQSEIILRGLPLTPGVCVVIPENVCLSWSLDEVVASKIISGEIEIKPNETSSISGFNNQISFLRGEVVDASGTPIVTNNAFSSSGGFRFRGTSVTGTIPANTTVNVDYQITQERYINGGLIIVDNIGPNDKLTAQVVDVNNVIGYGPGVVLDEFIKDFFIPHKTELNIALAYPAKIPAGLFLRLKYTSTHADGANLKCNLYLHWKAV